MPSVPTLPRMKVLQQAVLRRGMELMSQPRVLRLMANPRVSKAVVQGLVLLTWIRQRLPEGRQGLDASHNSKQET